MKKTHKTHTHIHTQNPATTKKLFCSSFTCKYIKNLKIYSNDGPLGEKHLFWVQLKLDVLPYVGTGDVIILR